MAFLSLGVIGAKKSEEFWSSPDIIPHVWYFSMQMVPVLLFANADINSRVASTVPFYYWAAASMMKKRDSLAWLVCLHNVAYLAVNFFIFPTEIGFL